MISRGLPPYNYRKTNVFPRRITEYRIDASVSTAELEVLARLFSESQDYFSSVSEKWHINMASYCPRQLEKVRREIILRHGISFYDRIFAIPNEKIAPSNLSTLSISQLEILYRQRALRLEARIKEGRETFTRFFETSIVDELERREASDALDKLKKDYCLLTNKNELEHMCTMLGLPLGDKSVCHDGETDKSIEALSAYVRLYSKFRTLSERECLVEYVDSALDILGTASEMQPLANLASEIAELDRRRIVNCPKWVNKSLSHAVEEWFKAPMVHETEMVMPLLTLAMIKDDLTLERRAQHIINRCYKRCVSGLCTVDDIFTAITYSTYVTRFSVRKITACWNVYCNNVVARMYKDILSCHLFRLIESANEIGEFASIETALKERLIEMLTERLYNGDTVAGIYLRSLSVSQPVGIGIAV